MSDSESLPPEDPRDMDERSIPVDMDRWKSEFAAVNWSKLIPFRNWLADQPWTLVWVQFISFAFGCPFLLMYYYVHRESTLAEASWAFGIYFSVIWAAVIHRCLRPEPVGMQRILGTWLFTSVLGMIAVVVVTVVGEILPGVRDLFATTESASIFGRLIGMTLAVGLVEEAVKLLPVLWFVRRFVQPPRPTTVAYLGVISGLAFGATEAILYSFMYAAGHASSAIGYGDYLIVQLLRLISLPLLHAIWTGIAGYFVGLAARTAVASRVLILTGLLGVSILHGLYNTFADSWFGLLIAMLSLAVFIGYIRNEDTALGAVAQEDLVRGDKEDPPDSAVNG